MEEGVSKMNFSPIDKPHNIASGHLAYEKLF